jgi:hypothetical protein
MPARRVLAGALLFFSDAGTTGLLALLSRWRVFFSSLRANRARERALD